MHKGLWIARKIYLFSLIKKVSDSYGGDDKDFLDRHSLQVLDTHPEEQIELAIRCYEGVSTGCLHHFRPAKSQTPVDQGIVYRAPFIRPPEVHRG